MTERLRNTLALMLQQRFVMEAGGSRIFFLLKSTNKQIQKVIHNRGQAEKKVRSVPAHSLIHLFASDLILFLPDLDCELCLWTLITKGATRVAKGSKLGKRGQHNECEQAWTTLCKDR